jgi:microcystin-dependent protein
MEGTIGEIRGFAGTFCPANWAYCWGQTMPIQTFTPLFAVIGITYGGNGTTNFLLPDLRGRIPVGAGQGAGLSIAWTQGLAAGVESSSIQVPNMPSHSHVATTTGMTVTGTATGTVTPRCYGDAGGVDTPAGSVMGSGSGIYAAAGDADANMAPINASLNINGSVGGNVSIGYTGNSQPISNIQPSLAIAWIICLQGNFPFRD